MSDITVADIFKWLKDGTWIYTYCIRPFPMGRGRYLHKLGDYIIEEHRHEFYLFKKKSSCLYSLVGFIKQDDEDENNFEVVGYDEFLEFYKLVQYWGECDV